MERKTLIEVDVAFKQVQKTPIFCRLKLLFVRYHDRSRRYWNLSNLVEEVASIYSKGLDPEAVGDPKPWRHNDSRCYIAQRVGSLCISQYRDRVRFYFLI